MKDNQWANGHFSISLKDEINVLIQDNRFDFSRECLIHVDDFEGLLKALLGTFEKGKTKGIDLIADQFAPTIKNEKP